MCFSNSSESPLVCTGFKNWKKALGENGYIDQHKDSVNHRIADKKSGFISTTRYRYSGKGSLTSF